MVAATGKPARREHCQMTHAQLAEIFGVTRARIMQIERRALNKIRKHPIMVQLAKDAGILPD